MSIENYLKSWISKYKNDLGIESAFYEYHKYSETHFLKLNPEAIIDDDKHQLVLSNLIIDFEEMFPREMLCIIGDNSLTKLENPEALLIPEFKWSEAILNRGLIYTPLSLNAYTLALGINPSTLNVNPVEEFNFSFQQLNSISYHYYFDDCDINIQSAAEPSIKYGYKKEVEIDSDYPLAA
jgi:hypothetical protein